MASGSGSSAQEAETKARGAALRGLFAGLGKDGLFAEVFAASPPIGLGFQLLDSSKEGIGYTARVKLKVDDESIRIIERGPYLASAVGILDKAEAFSDEAEARRASGSSSETGGDLGAALGQYGMSMDSCRSALQLVDPVGDPGIFSSKGKRTAVELKKELASTLVQASAGAERVRKAEAALAVDAKNAAASDVAEAALVAAEEAQALLDEIAPILGDVSAYGEERLSPLRDRIALRRRSLLDSKAALEHADTALPEKSGYAYDKLDFARRRISTTDAFLVSADRALDREIRDPAARRTARTQAIRWSLLHEPREYLSLRAYLPFEVSAGEKSLESSPMDAVAGLDGAFAFGRGGVWVRSQAKLVNTDLAPGEPGGDELAVTQSFDFGVWGEGLYFAGYTWDWLRRVDEVDFRNLGSVKLGLGGVYEHGNSEERFRRADWLLSLSYELPTTQASSLANALNAGLEAQFRLGSIALFEASVSKRLDQLSDASYVSVLSWSIGLGIRLPPPFAYGAEYRGAYVQRVLGDGSLGEALGFDVGRFMFFVQYSI